MIPICVVRALVAAPFLLISHPILASSETIEDNPRIEIIASFEAGAWKAEAFYFKSTSYSDRYTPRYECKMSTSGVGYQQIRPPESGTMQSGWLFFEDATKQGGHLRLQAIKVRGTRFELAELPWRLSGPPAPGSIALTFDLHMLAFRRSKADEWLPFEYLTDQLLQVDEFELFYTSEGDEGEPHAEHKTVSMKGFREAAKWCGKQLLSDRMDELQTRELTD